MHRSQHARTHQERAQQRQRERHDRQQHGPDLEAAALLGDGKRVNQCRSQQPRHEGRVLHRVPEPPATPAEFVVRPPAPQCDADGEKHPGHGGPGTRPPRPGRVELAPKQRSDRKGKGNRKADVTHVQHRRVNDHSGILQQRIQVTPVGRGRQQALERVRREQHEQQEADRNQRHHAENARHHFEGQMAAEQRHRQHPPREHQHPQQQRAFVTTPGRGETVKPRQAGIGIIDDV